MQAVIIQMVIILHAAFGCVFLFLYRQHPGRFSRPKPGLSHPTLNERLVLFAIEGGSHRPEQLVELIGLGQIVDALRQR